MLYNLIYTVREKMDILAFDFFEKTINTYLKLEICVVLVRREFLAFKYIFIVFLNKFIYVHHKS